MRNAKAATEAALRQIAVSTGLEGGVVVEKVKGLPQGHSLDAATGVYEDLLAAGVPGPTKVAGPRCRTPRRSPRCS